MSICAADINGSRVHEFAEILLGSGHVHAENKARVVGGLKDAGIDKVLNAYLFAFLES